MSQQSDSEEKSHEPSQRKLDQARKKGDIPKTADLMSGLAYCGFLASFSLLTPTLFDQVGTLLTTVLTHSDTLGARLLGAPAMHGSAGVMRTTVTMSVPFFALPFTLVAIALVATRSLTFQASKLAPKLERLSPVQTAKQKFGRAGLFEFAKSFAKLLIVSATLFWFLSCDLPLLIETSGRDPRQIVLILGQSALRFLVAITGLTMVMGVLDALWQHAEHRRKNRMSHKEMRDEHKEAEGDPAMKQARRARAQEIASQNSMNEVPNSDVVIVNPTHYAVALRWDRASGGAPICTAKGVDAMAARIRTIAAESGVPLRSDPPTARSLYACLDIGDEVQPDQYAAVAAAIRFADDMRSRARRKA